MNRPPARTRRPRRRLPPLVPTARMRPTPIVRRAAALAAGLVLAGCSAESPAPPPPAPSPPPAPAAPADAGELDGRWRVVSINGRAAGVPPGLTVAIDGGTYAESVGGEIVAGAGLTADPAADPKVYDLSYTSGEFAGRTLRGIYELDGGTLRTAAAPPGGDRPTGFGGGTEVWELRRE